MLARLGYVKRLPRGWRCFTAIVLLLAKRQVVLLRGSVMPSTFVTWLWDMTYCDTARELYASLQPPMSRQRDIWQSLRDYFLTESDEEHEEVGDVSP
ncbi:hypothetical protein NDU88_009252 [Pleurodeles waltl]|uniref:Uncharacterized protein n=1 Tax=Pleurodeles waltl TaxID=8319 RepID=A0AAV7RX38_PLEWA|nr:hypothetical protein NDU88_009252 [Pleurodeles waltl]